MNTVPNTVPQENRRKIQIKHIPRKIFDELTIGGQQIELTTQNMCGIRTRVFIAKIFIPRFAEHNIWLRYIVSADGKYTICGLELHADENSARETTSDVPSGQVLKFIAFFKARFYATGIIVTSSTSETIAPQLNDVAGFIEDRAVELQKE